MPNLVTNFITLISVFSIINHSFSQESPVDDHILIILDDWGIKSSHSIFLNSLQTRGMDLEFKLGTDKIELQRYGRYLYDALILFCPTTERDEGLLDVAAVLDFVDSGHDLILAADVGASDWIKNISTENGADFDEDSSAVVIDHIHYAVSESDGDHSLIASDDFIRSDVILGSKKIQAPVLFKGIGHTINPGNNLALKILSASSSAYSANPDSTLSTPPTLTGSAISLVSVVQARNNARVMISGSLDIFSNRFFKSSVQKAGGSDRYEVSGNEQFVTEVSKWIFHERGHLKAVNVGHHKVGETDEPTLYRINDDLHYSLEISEWRGTNWEPYVSNDVQLQFFMMSPYVLKTLTADDKGRYYTQLKVPDVYGVFQLKVEYQRLGYTTLSLSKQIPVRPFRNNEYERFIPTAFPYYGASFSTMAGFFVFTAVYLYNKFQGYITSESKNKMQNAPILNVDVSEDSSVCEVHSTKEKSLLVYRYSFHIF